jgi:hypothetical protein
MERRRAEHTCARCGRVGYNAFRSAPAADSEEEEWVCSHEDPCRARRRLGWRRSTAEGLGRRRSAQFQLRLEDGMTACVIGADPKGRERLATILAEQTALPPRSIELSPRSLSSLSRGRYCLIVVDVSPADPIAYRNELARRLRSRAHRDLPIVLCWNEGHEPRPPLSGLMELPNVTVLRRPFDARHFVDGVEAALLRTADPGERYV